MIFIIIIHRNTVRLVIRIRRKKNASKEYVNTNKYKKQARKQNTYNTPQKNQFTGTLFDSHGEMTRPFSNASREHLMSTVRCYHDLLNNAFYEEVAVEDAFIAMEVRTARKGKERRGIKGKERVEMKGKESGGLKGKEIGGRKEERGEGRGMYSEGGKKKGEGERGMKGKVKGE